MPDASPPAYRQCRSLLKGLELLSALNRQPAGSAGIVELARLVGQHRTTVKRLLETLREAQYVEHDGETGLYRLSARVQQLSGGYRDPLRLTELAWPHLRALSKAVVWPCSLLVPEGDEMVVRASTRSYSPLSFHPGMPGRRLPMLRTAAGRVYFAHAPDEEQRTLLAMIASRPGIDGESARDATAVRRLIARTRERGQGLNLGDWSEEPKFGGLAAPIRLGQRPVAVVNIIFLTRALSDERALKPLQDALATAVAGIEADASR